MADLPDTVGRYQIVRLLGRGGMGAVYLARDPRINRQVVVKFLGDWIDDVDTRKRFAREAQSAGGLRHPNIVTIFDVDEYDGRPFIVMEYVPGETLQELIRRKADLSVPRRLQIIEDLAAGIAHAHAAGIIHRDIKPGNIVVDQSGVVKILDFGIAKTDDTELTKTGAISGTLNYMAPELILSGVIDHRADIFALGAVMYELVSYRQAFPGTIHDGLLRRITAEAPPPLGEANREVDREVEEVVARALAKRPEDRFGDLSEMRAALEKIRKRLSIPPDPARSQVDRPRIRATRSRGRPEVLAGGRDCCGVRGWSLDRVEPEPPRLAER